MLQPLSQLHTGLHGNCNLACPFCSSIEQGKTGALSETAWRSLLEQAYALGCVKVNLVCGEPLLDTKHLQLFCQDAQLLNISVNISTNGLLLTEDVAAKLKEWGVRRVQISVDYPDERHNAYREHPQLLATATRAMNAAKQHGLILRITSTARSEDVEFYRKMLKFAEANKADELYFLPLRNQAELSVRLPQYFHSICSFLHEQGEKQSIRILVHDPLVLLSPLAARYFDGCQVGNILHVSPNGDARACPFQREPIGTIHRESLQALHEKAQANPHFIHCSDKREYPIDILDQVMLTKSKGLVERRLEDASLAIYDPVADKIHSLNETAALLWDLMEDGTTLATLVSGCMNTYGDTSNSIAFDIVETLTHMVREGIVVETLLDPCTADG